MAFPSREVGRARLGRPAGRAGWRAGEFAGGRAPKELLNVRAREVRPPGDVQRVQMASLDVPPAPGVRAPNLDQPRCESDKVRRTVAIEFRSLHFLTIAYRHPSISWWDCEGLCEE
jgi:hypothetical protein